MEAPMTRLKRRPALEIQESFENTRLGPKCLVEAYSRVVPVQRKAVNPVKRTPAQTCAAPARFRGGEHG
jgi:hypothetical protein